MIVNFRSLALSLVLAAVPLAAADDWPMYLRDLSHSSFNSAESTLGKDNAPNLATVWEQHLYSPMAAAPTIVDGVIYVGVWGGSLYAIDAATGALKWWNWVGQAPRAAEGCSGGLGVSGQAVVAGDIVYVPGGDSAIYALNKTSGELVWRLPLAEPTSGSYLWASLTIFNNALYAGVSALSDCLARGALIRIDLDNPQEPLFRWLTPENEVGAGVWLTPAFDAATNTVYVTTGSGNQDPEAGNWGGSMLALDATTLEIKSHFFLPTNSLEANIHWGSSPTLFETSTGEPMIAATGKDGLLYAQHREDLTPAWKIVLALGCTCPQCGCGSLSTPAFDGKVLYVGAGAAPDADTEAGSVYAVNPDDGTVLWHRLLNAPVLAPVTVANGVLYVSTLTGLEIFEADTGNELWYGPPNRIFSQPVVVNGAVFTTQVDGRVICLRPVTAEEPPHEDEPPASLPAVAPAPELGKKVPADARQ